MLKIFVYGNRKYPIVQQSVELIEKRYDTVMITELGELENADLAIAPSLTKILKVEDIEKPRLGTLVFHPSLLPIHRGRDAIKWAVHLGDKVSGATWFWADEGIDTGDVCEQVPLPITDGESPRDFYFEKVIPAAIDMLSDILDDLENGYVRRRQQNERYATYEERF